MKTFLLVLCIMILLLNLVHSLDLLQGTDQVKKQGLTTGLNKTVEAAKFGLSSIK